MLISVCIPHYNRVRHLLIVLDSVAAQDHPHLEVVISDDCSTDDSASRIPDYLRGKSDSHVRFKYIRQPANLGYDTNLRAALQNAEGEYLFVLGNDDALAHATTMSRLAGLLHDLNFPDVAFANFFPYGRAADVAKRAAATRVIGSGPEVAAKNFRSFSFVGGIVIRRAAFEANDSSSHDHSIYFQIYLAARIVASGGTLASIANAMVAKDVVVDGHPAASFADTLEADSQRLQPMTGGLDQVGVVACDAIIPFVPENQRSRFLYLIYYQIFAFTYPYWLFTYRQLGVYRAALNLALGCRPQSLIKVDAVPFFVRFRLELLYLGATMAGLLTPLWVLSRLQPAVRAIARKLLRSTTG